MFIGHFYRDHPTFLTFDYISVGAFSDTIIGNKIKCNLLYMKILNADRFVSAEYNYE